MPNATKMCNAARRSEVANVNPSVTLDYFDLAYGAEQEGMITMSSDKTRKKLLEAIENYHKTNLTGAKFERVCVSSNILERIWNMTMTAELMLNSHHNLEEYDEIHLDFEKSASTKLCKLNVAKTLNDSAWTIFFQSH